MIGEAGTSVTCGKAGKFPARRRPICRRLDERKGRCSCQAQVPGTPARHRRCVCGGKTARTRR